MAEISEKDANSNTKSLQELKNCLLLGSNLTALEHPTFEAHTEKPKFFYSYMYYSSLIMYWRKSGK